VDESHRPSETDRTESFPRADGLVADCDGQDDCSQICSAAVPALVRDELSIQPMSCTFY